jgi:acyl-phosphate glycerol 3-phosphate acyltransferase
MTSPATSVPIMEFVLPVAIVLGAYLLGAIPFGWLVARAKGVDIFQAGSGNIGATNVGRVLGRKLGALVFALDFLKGACPVLGALWIKPGLSESYWRAGWLEVAAGLAAFLGHCFPIYLRFHGGKGVATGAGVVAVLVPLPAAAALLAWLVTIGVSRYVSLASVIAALTLCVVQATLTSSDLHEPRTYFALLAAILVVARHRANLSRLSMGTENRLEESPATSLLPKLLHVLALGLWFGMSVFFTFVATPSLFTTFETVGQRSADERPAWFPLPESFTRIDQEIHGPKEQGSRAAGAVVGPMFPWYFLLQGICGLVALGTSFAWVKLGKADRWRTVLLLLAMIGVLAGWPVEQYVTELRPTRNSATDAYLREGGADKLAAMKEARGTFGGWHVVSLILNFATILAVTGAMALAANLPQAYRGNPGGANSN